MNARSFSARWQGFLHQADTLQGVQLAAAVALAYGVSAALGLPENFWAVMSALIVVRPNAGATLDAGWERLAGTIAGSLAGLAGAWLLHLGHGGALVTLCIVAALAFLTAGRPSLRSAPIAALIVLSGAAMAGHSAAGVALARVAEIVVGVAAGFAVAWVSRHLNLHPRADALYARLLREIAALLRQAALAGEPAGEPPGRPPAQPPAKTPATSDLGARVRDTVRQIAFVLHRSRETEDRERLAACMRLSQDGAAIARVIKGGRVAGAAASAERIAARLEQAADAMATGGPVALDWSQEPTFGADPLRWLARDLDGLLALRQGR